MRCLGHAPLMSAGIVGNRRYWDTPPSDVRALAEKLRVDVFAQINRIRNLDAHSRMPHAAHLWRIL
jgi:hypothetical protein